MDLIDDIRLMRVEAVPWGKAILFGQCLIWCISPQSLLNQFINSGPFR